MLPFKVLLPRRDQEGKNRRGSPGFCCQFNWLARGQKKKDEDPRGSKLIRGGPPKVSPLGRAQTLLALKGGPLLTNGVTNHYQLRGHAISRGSLACMLTFVEGKWNPEESLVFVFFSPESGASIT